MVMYRTIYVIMSYSLARKEEMLAEAFTDRNLAEKQLQHFRESFKGWNTFRLVTTTLVTDDGNE